MAKPTQKQIAELSGVSQSIVSKVLRGQTPRNMSKAKIKAIHDAAKELGYQLPTEKPAKIPKPETPPTAPTPPKTAPKKPTMPKFGATPQGDPLHKYGKQWRSRVAQTTGLMPQGKFTDLRYGEQKQVMGILNNIDKDGKKRTELTKKNYKTNEARSRIWKGVAVGAGAVGVPLTIAGLMSKLTDLISDTANIARQGATLGIDPDRLVAMSRQAEIYGVQGEEFASSLRSIQTLMTNMQLGVSNELMSNLAKYATGANIGRLQTIANKGTATDFVKELYKQTQQGRISRRQVVELLGQSGAGGLTELFTNKKLMQVLTAKPIEGAAQSAIELDQMLGQLKVKFEDIFIKNFPAINAGLDKFSKWLDEADFSTLTALFGDLTDAITFVVSNIPGFETTQELLGERQKLVERQQSDKYMSGIMKLRLKEINEDLTKRGINPETYTPPNFNNAAKQNADTVTQQSGRVEHVHRFELDISANTNGTLPPEQMENLRQEVSAVIENYMKNDKIKIVEKYS